MNSSILSKDVLVTGGTGYIGSYLITYLIKKGIDVAALFKRIETVDYLIPANIIINCAGRKPGKKVKITNYINDNIVAVEHLVRHSPGCRIIHLSSMSIYSMSQYGATKLISEQIISEKTKGSIIIRLPKIIEENIDCQFVQNEHKIYIASSPVMGIDNLAEFIYKHILKAV